MFQLVEPSWNRSKCQETWAELTESVVKLVITTTMEGLIIVVVLRIFISTVILATSGRAADQQHIEPVDIETSAEQASPG